MTYGRYHVVRNWWLPTWTLSEPYVLDRHEQRLYPYRGTGEAKAEHDAKADRRESLAKWERMKRRVGDETTVLRQQRLADRLVSQNADCQRLAAIFGKGSLIPLRLLYESQLGSITTQALSSNYVAGTSGIGNAVRYAVPVGGKTLNSVYFYISSYTGTAANVNDISLELRPEASAGALTPNTSTLTEGKVVDPASATGWIASTGWTTAMAALSRYFVVVGDADGNGTDNAVINSRIVFWDSATVTQQFSRFMTATTTAGWASGNSVVTSLSSMVLGFSDGSAVGNPLSTNTTPANNTQQRGLRITTAGLVASVPLFGIIWSGSTTVTTGIKIFDGTTAPNGTAVNSSTDQLYGGTAGNFGGCLTSGGTPYTLNAGTAYSIVATYGSATTNGPRRMDIGTGEDATLRKAMPGQGEFYWRQDDGGSTWSNDLVGSLPSMGLLIDGYAAVAASGGIIVPTAVFGTEGVFLGA